MMELKTKLSIFNVDAGYKFLEQAALKVYSYSSYSIKQGVLAVFRKSAFLLNSS